MAKRHIRVGKPKIGGAVFRRPVNMAGALPVDSKTSLDASFIDQGGVSEEGVSLVHTNSKEKIKIWGGEIGAVISTEKGAKLSFVLVESGNAEVLKTIFGADAVSVTAATSTAGEKISLAYDAAEIENSTWVVDTISGKSLQRLVIPDGAIATESLDVVYRDNEIIAYQVEIEALRDADGNFYYQYTDDGETTV